MPRDDGHTELHSVEQDSFSGADRRELKKL